MIYVGFVEGGLLFRLADAVLLVCNGRQKHGTCSLFLNLFVFKNLKADFLGGHCGGSII
jgi:hypothetical protein